MKHLLRAGALVSGALVLLAGLPVEVDAQGRAELSQGLPSVQGSLVELNRSATDIIDKVGVCGAVLTLLQDGLLAIGDEFSQIGNDLIPPHRAVHWVSPDFLNRSDWFTTVNLLNPGSSEIQYTINWYFTLGTKCGTWTGELEANEAVSRTSECDTDVLIDPGKVEVIATGPILPSGYVVFTTVESWDARYTMKWYPIAKAEN